jgi:eukaryotic-like serine/threonine-protein kinase
MIGKVIADRFRIESVVGEGQMSRVYVAEQLSMKRRVALKILRDELARDRDAVERFRLEVAAVTRLRSPHTIQFFDFGESPLFIAMELLEGETLRTRLERDRQLSYDDVRAIVEQIAESLTEAHAADVLHRDLKPENVFLCGTPAPPKPFIKVLDFGLAKLLDRSDRITAPSTTVGTPAYLAPEVALPGKTVDKRADLYSLGVITFEMLTGHRPFDAPSPMMMMLAHASEPVPDAYGDRPDLPSGLNAFMQVVLAKDPDERLADAATFAHVLDSALRES